MKSVTMYCLMVVGCLCMATHMAHAGNPQQTQDQGQGQQQGQLQGQGQGQAQGQTTDVDNHLTIGGGFATSTLSPSARSDADASVRNSGNSESDSVALSGSRSGSESGASSSIVTNEAHIPGPAAASPASVYVDMCSRGASISTPVMGGTLGSGDVFCKKLALADAFFRADAACVTSETVTCSARNKGMVLLDEALNDLHRQTAVSSYFDWLPIIGGLF